MRMFATLAVVLVSLISLAKGAAAQTPIGIAACDDFLTKYEACVAKMPAANQATFKMQIDQMRTGWATMAGTPETKTALESTCTQMATTMKASMTQFGCQW
jgi:hypothetical protein